MLSLRGLVLRRIVISQPQSQEKLAPNWKDPYEIEKVVRFGTYRLKKLGGTMLP
ncbi:hypothetical protein COCNU_03G015220 [Cocos nucifera]|uniref:Uncharacterized protein n=1 Tax=Cocos nucifera TaxID=13894 RepID=A0A8K0I468_COCNU|nr:hypothetical protein COCNU_03G015220 [Cocos nucifera]